MRPPTIDDVRGIWYFDALSDGDAAALANELIPRTYGPRELIAVEQEPSKGFYYLRKGSVRIFRTSADGREQSFRLATAGDTFGEVPVFDGGPNPATVEALERCEVLLVPTETFRRVVQEHPEVAMTLLNHFARRIRGFTELVGQLSLQTVQSRLARYLYQLAREEGTPTNEGIVVKRDLTVQDLASLVGSVREVVGRTLRTFQEDGIIEMRRKEIVVRDLRLLARLI